MDADAKKTALRMIPYGIYVLTADDGKGGVAAAIDEILAICKEHNIPCGHPHVDANNVETLVEKGFRWLMPGPSQSFAALQKGLVASGRK